jgi:cytochrome P450
MSMETYYIRSLPLCRVAGNDTVSITLTAIFYHLAANPSSLARLHQELDQATTEGALSPIITYKEAASLPYLSAVINEGFRIHPLFGYPVPRVVPKGGAEVCGRWWPGGTVLGTSCGVPEKSKEMFGDDAESWGPERWLVEKERAARMWDEVCAFGIGQRACIGQHVSSLISWFGIRSVCERCWVIVRFAVSREHLLIQETQIARCEIATLIPQFLREFNIESASEWQCLERWFNKPQNIRVKVTRRNKT